jgi:hypothetical protein
MNPLHGNFPDGRVSRIEDDKDDFFYFTATTPFLGEIEDVWISVYTCMNDSKMVEIHVEPRVENMIGSKSKHLVRTLYECLTKNMNKKPNHLAYGVCGLGSYPIKY